MRRIIVAVLTTLLLLSILGISSVFAQTPDWTSGTGLLYANPTSTKIGIGVLDPGAYKLYVLGETYLKTTLDSPPFYLDNSSLSNATRLRFRINGSDRWSLDARGAAENDDFRFYRFNGSWIPDMVIQYATGNIGIGTPGPQAKLHLNNSGAVSMFISDGTATWQIDNGQESAGIFSITENGIARRLVIKNNTGNVGIGTTGPLSKLSINGGLHVGGDSDAGDDNLLVDGVITSIGNVSIQGHYLGRGNSTAQPGNLAFGGGAMPNLNSNASTDHNVAIGQYALNANVSGAENFGLGYAAAYKITASNNNVAIGTAAMFNHTNGSDKIAIGFHSLMGPGSAGNYGSNNIAIGTNAGVNASGSNNILLGYRAAENLTTGANNIVIGYDIDLPAVGSANMLDIGNLIYATGLTSTGTVVSTGNVGIGTNTPGAKLEVNGDVMLSNGANRNIKIASVTSGDGNNLTVAAGATSAMLSGGTLHLTGGNSGGGGGNVYMYGGDGQGKGNVIFAHTGSAARGKVLIGKTTPNAGTNYLLDVAGSVRANEVVVNTDGSDFVFENDYALRSIDEVEKFVKENKHLPEIPSAKEMQENGVGVSELQTKLLQKIEELTLYVIDQNKRIGKLEKENMELRGIK